MQIEALFADLTRDFCGGLLDGMDAPLEDRVGRVVQTLGPVVATGAALPIVPGTLPAFRSSMLEGWPGLGTYEDYWRESPEGPVPMRLSETLKVVHQQLWAGLEQWESGELERAVGTWSLGYEQTWGPAGLEVLGQLHPAFVGYRQDRRQRARRPTRPGASLVMVANREPPASTGRPTLGLRLSPVPGGVEVLAVHPRGPAAGRLQTGDIVLTVEGASLDGLPEEAAGPALTGPIGTVRRYEVWRDGATLFVELRSIGIEELG